jgi:alpha-tubulin suppressor-like RCC1 family protein
MCNMQGEVFAFGHPDYGQLGFGTDGKFLKDGGKGPALQHSCVTQPRKIQKFLVKDKKGNVTETVLSADIKIVAVAAGKNHSMCLEQDPVEDNAFLVSDETKSTEPSTAVPRVFSWGFGGYGRLGHNCADDEKFPREISQFKFMRGTKSFRQVIILYCYYHYFLNFIIVS